MKTSTNSVKRMLTRRTLPATFAALLVACADVSMKPYQTPDAPSKNAWSRQQSLPVAPGEMITVDWWKQFRDPYLDGLVGRALKSNVDLKILAARIQVANAEIGEARAGALPTLDAGAGASFEKTTGKNFAKTFNLGTQVNWDIDVWGKVAKGVQAQSAEFSATSSSRTRGPNFSKKSTTPDIVFQKLIRLSCKLGPRMRADDGSSQRVAARLAHEVVI